MASCDSYTDIAANSDSALATAQEKVQLTSHGSAALFSNKDLSSIESVFPSGLGSVDLHMGQDIARNSITQQ